jgi:AcrR family transcriptional regulator
MDAAPKARQRMIDSALELFHQQGVNATSIDQILEKSETGKSQFSHYFKNKEGVVRAVIESLSQVIKSGEAPTGYNVKTWKDFEGWFQSYIDFQKATKFELSCPIGTIGNDIRDEQKLLRQDVKLFLQWSRNQLTLFFAQKKAAGELKDAADPEGLADLCMAVMQGGMLMTKVQRDSELFENSAKQAIRYVRSLRT